MIFALVGILYLTVIALLIVAIILLSCILFRNKMSISKEDLQAEVAEVKKSVSDAVKRLTDIINNNKNPDGSIVLSQEEAAALMGDLQGTDSEADAAGV